MDDLPRKLPKTYLKVHIVRDPLSDILLAGRISGAIPVRFESRGGYAMRFPAFRHLKFGAVLSGSMELHPQNGPPLHLGPGDVYLLTDGAPYVSRTGDHPEMDGQAYFASHRDLDGVVRFGAGPPEKVTIGGRFTFDEIGAEWIRRALPPAIRIPASSPFAAPMRTTLSLLVEETNAGAAGESLIVTRLADILLVQALRAYLAMNGGEAPTWLSALADPRLARALRAFHARIADDWSVERLAAEAGMSRSSFAANFRRRTGLTPMDYVARWRLFRIRTDLMASHRAISIIAEEHGWRSRTSCSQAFKALFGVSPREARQQAMAADVTPEMD